MHPAGFVDQHAGINSLAQRALKAKQTAAAAAAAMPES
jgi:hypothetical protein